MTKRIKEMIFAFLDFSVPKTKKNFERSILINSGFSFRLEGFKTFHHALLRSLFAPPSGSTDFENRPLELNTWKKCNSLV